MIKSISMMAVALFTFSWTTAQKTVIELTFVDHLTAGLIEQDVFVKKGKKVKAKGKRPAYKYWEYYDTSTMYSTRGTGMDTFWFYHYAAVYELDEKEIALVFYWPVFKKPKPDVKYRKIAKVMIESLMPLKKSSKRQQTSSAWHSVSQPC